MVTATTKLHARTLADGRPAIVNVTTLTEVMPPTYSQALARSEKTVTVVRYLAQV